VKLARLLLQAFGPFTDKELDFTGNGGSKVSNLHLIYGPNEAGKSSALRAMTDLRFGIPLRSQDDFVHASNQLRIAGVFLDEKGEAVGLIRRKGRGATLLRFDVPSDQPYASPEAGQEYEEALTGGLNRDEFEAMFGLDHGRLRAGGARLLQGEGELGEALFEASAGTRGIKAILAGIEADAKALFNPHGRAQSATINESRRQIDEQRNLWREAQVRPDDWQTLNRAHELARDALAEIDRALETQRRRENDLTQLRAVEPLLREHDRTQAALLALEEIPELAECAREDRLAALQALRRAQADTQDAARELARCAEALGAIVVETRLLEHADAIERLSASAQMVERSRIEVRQGQAVIDRIEDDMAAAAARIAPERSIRELLDAAPSAADRVALEGKLAAIDRLGERLDAYRHRADELDQAETNNMSGMPTLPDPVARQMLVAALRAAQELGDISQRIAEADLVIGGLDAQLTQAMSDLGGRSIDALRELRPLLVAQMVSARKAFSDIDEAVRRCCEEDIRLEADLKQQQIRQRQLAAAGEIVTADTLRHARERRDEGWALIRQAYVERSQDVDHLSRNFDRHRALPEAFEAAQGDADRHADLLRADATRAAGYEECATRIKDMQTRRAAIAVELTKLRARHRSLQDHWSRQLADAGLPDLDAEALQEWQTARAGVLDVADRLAQAQASRQRMESQAKTAAATLSKALVGVGQFVQNQALPQLLDQAERWEKCATQTEAEQSVRVKAEQARQAERAKVDTLVSKAEAELGNHLAAVNTWHARLLLAPGSAPETVKVRLDELDSLARESGALAEAKMRQAQQQAVVEDFATQAKCLATVLGESLPQPGLEEDFADRLKRRLATSRTQEQQRKELIRERTRAQETQRNAEAEQAAQADILARLCEAAGVNMVAHLPEREDSAARKRLLRGSLAAQRQQLANASIRSEDELRIMLADQDAIAIDSERERCRAEITRLEQEQTAARRTEEQTRRALEAVDSSNRAATAREAMEAASARCRSAIVPWARLKLAHALLQEALNRFRERAQAPMVAAASAYFSLMTGGRYQRLVADETDNKPVLRAERENGEFIGVDAMSEGTADQLYLALRLAALELRRTSHPRMPLILDEVLVTSDDERAANVLRALARFAEGGQVMLFTHHRHMIDLAHKALSEQGVATHTL